MQQLGAYNRAIGIYTSNVQLTHGERTFNSGSLTNVHCRTFCNRWRTIFFRSHSNVHYAVVYSDDWAILINISPALGRNIGPISRVTWAVT